LTDFRSYSEVELELGSGLTALLGDNGEGKTNLLEAVGYLATLTSFRGAPNEALVHQGATQAIVRAEGERDGRTLLIEAEIPVSGRGRVLVTRQRLARTRDLLGALRVSVFAPDDLDLVKGGPAERRRFLDDTLVSTQPRLDLLRTDLDKVLRQRNALLRLKHQGCIVQLQLLQRLAQQPIVVGLGGVQPREHHRLGLLVARERLQCAVVAVR
jgi:DNA replication and repair protein RecF